MEGRLDTRAVHAGAARPMAYDALVTPVVMSSTYTFGSAAEIQEYVARRDDGDPGSRYEYGRYGNPTQEEAERRVADLDGGERALLFSSGMAAITTALLATLEAGDHLVAVEGLYRKTKAFFTEDLARWGIEVSIVPADALEDVARPTTRVVYFEIPTNPYLRVPDVARIVSVARRRGWTSIVDATFATPINLRPLEHGADVVLHSATKYLGGHNDLLAGAVIGSAERIAPIERTRGVLGGVSGPLDAYLLLRGLKTLALRVERQNATASRLAGFLEHHPAVGRVHYPGLPSHPDHETARRLLSGYGGVVSFELWGGLDAAAACIDRLDLTAVGPTLGGVESIAQPQAMFIARDPAQRAAHGVSDALIRYAVGIEAADDLIEDLKRALDGLPSGEAI